MKEERRIPEARPVETRQIVHPDPLIFEQGASGRGGSSLPKLDVPAIDPRAAFGALARAQAPLLPEVSEVEVTRHFTRLSRWNYAIDIGLYPLGSCTMKYNPKVNERAARLPGFAGLHPCKPESTMQGALELMWRLEGGLRELTGFARVTLQPAAGAHGELCGLMMIRAYHTRAGTQARRRCSSPTRARHQPGLLHRSTASTVVPPEDRRRWHHLDSTRCARPASSPRDIAGIMITNPSTLGLFEEHLGEIAELVHEAGGLVYMDGANLNALLGKVRPGESGVDVMHINLHKTFTTPHGGGGPGSGVVGVGASARAVPAGADGGAERATDIASTTHRPQSIGRMRSFYGNFGMFVRAYTYMREMGGQWAHAGHGDGGAERQLPARPLKRQLLARVRPAVHARGRASPTRSSRRRPACRRSTWPSGSWTTASTRRRSTSRCRPSPVARRAHDRAHRDRDAGDARALCASMRAIAVEATRDPEMVKSAPHQTALRPSRRDARRAHPHLRWTPPSKQS